MMNLQVIKTESSNPEFSRTDLQAMHTTLLRIAFKQGYPIKDHPYNPILGSKRQQIQAILSLLTYLDTQKAA